MNFKAEFHLYGNTGNQIVLADSFNDLLNHMEQRGYNFQLAEKDNIQKWEEMAKEGDRYFLAYNTGIIVKGNENMTDYTSL